MPNFPPSQSSAFSSSHVWMWEMDYKESWMPKNWCFWTVVLEKTLEGPLDCKIKPVNPKGNQSWIVIGRTDVEAEVQYFGHQMRRIDSLVKEEMGTTAWDSWMVSLTWWTWVWASSGSWWWTGMGSQKELDKIEWLNWLNWWKGTKDWFTQKYG